MDYLLVYFIISFSIDSMKYMFSKNYADWDSILYFSVVWKKSRLQNLKNFLQNTVQYMYFTMRNICSFEKDKNGMIYYVNII